MRITSISVTDFMGITAATVDTDRPLTVITGANGAGKSTLLQALRLCQTALEASRQGTHQLDAEWADAGRGNCSSWEVRVGMTFGSPDEQQLLDAFHRAAVLRLLHPEATDVLELSAVLDEKLPAASMSMLWGGELVVALDRRQRSYWSAGWQFHLGAATVHIQLVGPSAGCLIDGSFGMAPSQAQMRSELCASTNDIVERLRHDQISVDLSAAVQGRRIDFFAANVPHAPVQPDSVATVAEAVARDDRRPERMTFADVLLVLLSANVQVTDNHRPPLRSRFTTAELGGRPGAGNLVVDPALALFRLKNGSIDQRVRFAIILEIYQALTGDHVDCTFRAGEISDGEPTVVIIPTVRSRGAGTGAYEVPIERAGAGAVEALHLAVLLSDDRACIFLDEPAVHLSPTAQRRLVKLLRARKDNAGQIVCITHNPDLIPTHDGHDLADVVRLRRDGDEHRVSSLAPSDQKDAAAMTRLLASSEVRSLLFANGVLLFEGATDAAAFGRWLGDGSGSLPTPDEQNVVFLSVDGQKSFGTYVRLAARLGLPWAIVADGPALRPRSTMAGQLKGFGEPVPTSGTDLTDVRDAWSAVGVHTLAAQFGDDGTKSGEIEAFFEDCAPGVLGQIRQELGSAKGSRVGAAFAETVPCPDEVMTIWEQVVDRFR